MNSVNASDNSESNHPTCFRSPNLISRTDSALLVVDVQEKLITKIPEQETIIWNIDRLSRAAKLLQTPTAVTEQYPQRLGTTVAPIAGHFESATAKRMFSCRDCHSIIKQWNDHSIRQIVIVGIETHVCILQTVFDLQSAGFSVFVAVDAVGARNQIDHDIALRRIDSSGATLTTTESVLFEWCESSLADEFKQISKMVQEEPEAKTISGSSEQEKQ